MSHLINDNLIWIATPKCASYSIETALINSNLKLKKYREWDTKQDHIHATLNNCLDYFGSHESVCITRDWFEKWLSSINFIWNVLEQNLLEPVHKWENLNNEILYEIFNINFINNLHLQTIEENEKCFLSFIKNKKENLTKLPKYSLKVPGVVCTLLSENLWKSNRKCTYEFDIKELDKFVDFIEDRFGEKLIVDKINETRKRPSKIIINDELKSFVWERFEKPFEKRNKLI